MRGPIALLSTLLFALAMPGTGRAQESGAIAGEWIGVFQAYPQFVRMSLRLPAPGADGRVQTELRLEPLVETRSASRAPMGVVQVTAEYDASARTLVITPAAGAARVLGTRLASFSGVLDGERQFVAGVLIGGAASGSPYFILGRSSQAEAAFLKTVRSAATARPPARPARGGGRIPIRIRGGGRSPGQDGIRRWATRLLEEYPDIDPHRTEQGRLFAMARNLFRDEYFQPHFGRTFDTLSPNDLERIRQDISGIPAPRANFPEERANGAARAVERGFAVMTGTYASPDITLSVIAMRSIQAWRTQSLAWLEKASGDVLARIAAIERAESEVLALFWPSERTAFEGLLASSRSRIAGPLLRARIDGLLNQSTSYDTVPRLLQTLAAGPAIARPAVDARGRRAPATGRRPETRRTPPQATGDDISTLLGLVSADLRQEQLARVSSRIDQIVEAETGRDREALARLGTGLEGLQAGGRWYTEASAKYQQVLTHPAVQGLMRELAGRRAALLQKMEGPLTSRIRAARSASEVDQVRSTYLSVPSDRSDPAGGRLLQVAQTQQAGLRQEEQAIAAEARQRAAVREALERAQRQLDAETRVLWQEMRDESVRLPDGQLVFIVRGDPLLVPAQPGRPRPASAAERERIWRHLRGISSVIPDGRRIVVEDLPNGRSIMIVVPPSPDGPLRTLGGAEADAIWRLLQR